MILKNNYRIELAPTLTGHWYQVFDGDKDLGYFPSSTTILNAYPQSAHLTRWIAEHGMEEAERIRDDAGVSGTNVHTAIENLIAGAALQRMGYSLKEWWKISTFVSWWQEYKPKVIATEVALFSKKYKFAGRVDCITLDGDSNAVFIFQVGSALTTASASRVLLVNGAQACNVFWQIGSSVTLGTGSIFVGNLMALTSITLTTGVSVDGRVLARNGAVTLDTNIITKSSCAAPAPAPEPAPEPVPTPEPVPRSNRGGFFPPPPVPNPIPVPIPVSIPAVLPVEEETPTTIPAPKFIPDGKGLRPAYK